MDAKLKNQVVSDLARHEGLREYAYPDPLSKLFKQFPKLRWGFEPVSAIMPPGKSFDLGKPWTVGFGFTGGTLPHTRMSLSEAKKILEQHVINMDATLLIKLPLYRDASDVTKGVLINMAFNMGVSGLLGFKNSLKRIAAKQYAEAANNLRLSLWHGQVGSRARELVRRIETQTIEAAHRAA